ncbi:unnamed protein product [Phytophthora lilii]|uniref:Unnamed protein product n=1 Tax=Phytophthora lilii TaxID=2077276 RepID=A0A9W6XJV7_9STRA|nr:unnamed protein product [Phytophthora lilii]
MRDRYYRLRQNKVGAEGATVEAYKELAAVVAAERKGSKEDIEVTEEDKEYLTASSADEKDFSDAPDENDYFVATSDEVGDVAAVKQLIQEEVAGDVVASALATYTTIKKNRKAEKFSLPYKNSEWTFSEEDSPRLKVFETLDGRGVGVKTLQDLPRNAFVIECVGELISEKEKEQVADGRYLFGVAESKNDKTFTMYIYPDQVLGTLPSSSTIVASQNVGLS